MGLTQQSNINIPTNGSIIGHKRAHMNISPLESLFDVVLHINHSEGKIPIKYNKNQSILIFLNKKLIAGF